MLGVTVITGVQKKCVEPGCVQVWSQREHETGIAPPPMQDDDCRGRFIHWDEPTMEARSIYAAEPDLFLRQSEISGKSRRLTLRGCESTFEKCGHCIIRPGRESDR